ncbi:radical SAM family heme chaperone HemW [Sphingomicrobium astaxanthinifaciens]|uniref:radical SAM family heme chaperone HemW n=1 Tax=Sphingomicrobium astaxanthinifaciens TaxID=1227949 RepID=UPI001FCAF48D|nr:radical SAM family heme chaperone HemW [Sphingomicrobium astaxanthinifaciens]MCJ7422005.1 radical SAM family heme chaperone HemW [Sphingomicrobium astaxanthinifaciens]
MTAPAPAPSRPAADAPPLALYVHWPFCAKKCPYCDFNSHVREAVDQAAWRAALLADLAHEAALTPGHRLTSIFFGGGTPSLMPPETVAAVIDAAARHWACAEDLEVTLEANPQSAEAAGFRALASAGVNRLSLGLQRFDDASLAFLGRLHSAAEGLRALEAAQAAVERVSFDLITALPGDTPERFDKVLDRAIGLGTEHVSLYQLTIEPGTRFETMVRKGAFTPIDEDLGAELFELTSARMSAAGLPPYEISNHARPGAESRHNLAYWRYRDYAGIGPGAHGRRGGLRTFRHRKPENFLAAVARNGHGLREEAPLAPRQAAREALVMGLRLAEGIDPAAMAARFGVPAIDEDAARRLVDQGLLMWDERLRLSPAGRLLNDAILAEIAL